jgi:hypothetical protein
MLLHNNTPAHASLIIPQLSGETSDISCALSNILSGLSPSRLSLFPNLETTLKDSRSQTIEEIQDNAIRILDAITESGFQEYFQ